MEMKRTIALLIILALPLLLTGCGFNEQKEAQRVQETIGTFFTAARSGDVPSLRGVLAPNMDPEMIPGAYSFEGLDSFTKQIGNATFAQDAEKNRFAIVIVSLRGVSNNTASLRELFNDPSFELYLAQTDRFTLREDDGVWRIIEIKRLTTDNNLVSTKARLKEERYKTMMGGLVVSDVWVDRPSMYSGLYLHGTVTNEMDVPVSYVKVKGMLYRNGRVVAGDWSYVEGGGIPPGEGRQFEIIIDAPTGWEAYDAEVMDFDME